jgi:SAM-dependent methyltransferase
MNIEQARFNMIEQQIRPWEVLDQGVLSLLALVRREEFVPPAYRALAFIDTEVPLPDGEGGGQFMLAPRVEARLLQELTLARHEHVLEVGAGSGYMAALLAHQAARVTTLEIRPPLVAMARANLQRAGIVNAQVIDAVESRRPAGGHRRPGAGDARGAHQPHRRATVQARRVVRHRGAAPRWLRRTDAVSLLMHLASLLEPSVAKPWACAALTATTDVALFRQESCTP